MPKPCSLDLRERVLDAVETGASRREAGEPAPQRLHLRCAVEPEQPAECGWVSFLEMLGPLDAQQRHQQQRQQGRAQAIEGRADFAVELATDPKQSALDRFCCRSRLSFSTNSDSVAARR